MAFSENNNLSELNLTELSVEIWQKKYIILMFSTFFAVCSLVYLEFKSVMYEQKGEFYFYTDTVQFNNNQRLASEFSFDYLKNRSVSDLEGNNKAVNSEFIFNYDTRKKIVTLTVRGENSVDVASDFKLYSTQISNLSKADLKERKEIENEVIKNSLNSEFEDELGNRLTEVLSVNVYLLNLVDLQQVELVTISEKYSQPLELNKEFTSQYFVMGAVLGFVLSILATLISYCMKKKVILD